MYIESWCYFLSDCLRDVTYTVATDSNILHVQPVMDKIGKHGFGYLLTVNRPYRKPKNIPRICIEIKTKAVEMLLGNNPKMQR